MKAGKVFCNLFDAAVESQGFGNSPNFVEVCRGPKIPFLIYDAAVYSLLVRADNVQ